MLNKIMVIGNVGSDVEMRFTPNGNPVSSFRIATSRYFTGSNGEKQQETLWLTVTTWNKLAEACNQYLSKGKRAYVEGRLRTRTWEGQDGQKRSQVEVVAERVLFLDRNGAAGKPAEVKPTGEAAVDKALVEEEIASEDLPF
jgi:single-strand DNA-binding protein